MRKTPFVLGRGHGPSGLCPAKRKAPPLLTHETGTGPNDASSASRYHPLSAGRVPPCLRHSFARRNGALPFRTTGFLKNRSRGPLGRELSAIPRPGAFQPVNSLSFGLFSLWRTLLRHRVVSVIVPVFHRFFYCTTFFFPLARALIVPVQDPVGSGDQAVRIMIEHGHSTVLVQPQRAGTRIFVKII